MSKTFLTFEMQSGQTTEFACYEDSVHGIWARILGYVLAVLQPETTDAETSKRQIVKRASGSATSDPNCWVNQSP